MHGAIVKLAAFAALTCTNLGWAASSGGQAGNPTTPLLGDFAGGPYMSVPLSVSVPSTLLLNAAFNAKPPSGVVTSSEMYVTLSQNDIVISSLKMDYALGSYNDGARVSASGFAADPNRNSLTLAPGAYLLRITGYIGCPDGSPFNMTNMYIGWTLLSSASDRIYADGFGTIG